MISTRPLEAYPLVRTSSIDEMEAALGRIYVKPNMEIVGRERSLRAIHNHCQLQQIGLTYGCYGISARWKFPETAAFAHVFPIKGNVEFIVNGISTIVDHDRGLMVPDDASYGMANDKDYERVNLVIAPVALLATLSAFVGESLDAPLKMRPSPHADRHLARHLREHVMFLVGQLSSPSSPPLMMLREFEQTLMMMYLHANRHNYSDLLEEQAPNVAAWQVRRAEEYIETSWDRPITLEALAAETTVGARSLFRALHEKRGYSMSAFLTERRLQHARRMLQRPVESSTVTDVARDCGFSDMGQFARAYLQAFGEPPSETLNRANGARLTRH